MVTTNLAKRIRDFRYAKGWGPDELAVRAQISRTALYQIECGKTETPRAGTLSRIARALGLPIDVLMGLDEPHFGTSTESTAHWSEERFGRAETRPELAAPGAVRLGVASSAADPTVALSNAYAIDRELEEKFHDLLDSPLADGIVRLVEETHRLLPRRAPQPVG